MRLAVAIVVCTLCALSSVAAQEQGAGVAPSPSERRTALVIGNGAYGGGATLTNPPRAAAHMTTRLSRLGFRVIEGIDLDRDEMRRAFRQFGRELAQGGVGLFYFAGHGVELNGQNFLLPVDAEIASEEDLAVEAVRVDELVAKMSNARNRVNIVVLDACRDNPFAGSLGLTSRGLAEVNAPAGTLIAYATSPGKVATDGATYLAALSDEMMRPMTKVEEVFKNVRVRVKRETDGKQIPWESTSLESDFYFNAAGVAPSELMAMAPLAAIELDLPAAAPEPEDDTVAWIIGGVGGAALAAGVVFGVMAHETYQNATTLCPQARREREGCSDAAVNESSAALLQANLSNVGFGLGIAGIGVALYLLVSGSAATEERAGAPAALAAGVDRDGARVSLSGAF